MAKKFPDFQNFGEFLYYAYANLQMLHYALKDGKPRYAMDIPYNRRNIPIDYPQPKDYWAEKFDKDNTNRR